MSVSPRFGHWDATTMSLTDLGKAQLPGVSNSAPCCPATSHPPSKTRNGRAEHN